MNALAARMKYAESVLAMKTIQMQARWASRGSLFQPKIHSPMKVALEEEGGQPLDGKRCAEDIADEPGVFSPVHPELELLDDAGDHAHGEVHQEDLAEQPGQPQVGVLADAGSRLSA